MFSGTSAKNWLRNNERGLHDVLSGHRAAWAAQEKAEGAQEKGQEQKREMNINKMIQIKKRPFFNTRIELVAMVTSYKQSCQPDNN